MATIAVIGSGYVGTVTSVCFAGMGHEVICAVPDADRLDCLQRREVPFYEPGLASLLHTEVERGHLTFTSDVTAAIQQAEMVYLCVGAPSLPNGSADMKPLKKALDLMAPGFEPESPKLVVVSSTLPAQSTHWAQEQLTQLVKKRTGKAPQLNMAAVPHFLREGNAVKDFYSPDRIVIGASEQDAIDMLVKLYSPLGAPIFITDILSAELIKLGTNAFLGMKISFINTMAQLCEKLGADVGQVSRGLGMDRRISEAFLQAGIGYGGVFLPRDIQSLIMVAQNHHISFDLMKNTETINRYQRIHFMDRIVDAVGGNLEGKTVCVWGLAYRPNTDDMRESPSTQIVWGLQNRGATVQAYDPLAMDNAQEKLRGVNYATNPYDAAKGADIIALLTEWSEFEDIDFSRLKEVSACRLLVDGRNVYVPKRMGELGFTYLSVGRPTVRPNPSGS